MKSNHDTAATKTGSATDNLTQNAGVISHES